MRHLVEEGATDVQGLPLLAQPAPRKNKISRNIKAIVNPNKRIQNTRNFYMAVLHVSNKIVLFVRLSFSFYKPPLVYCPINSASTFIILIPIFTWPSFQEETGYKMALVFIRPRI